MEKSFNISFIESPPINAEFQAMNEVFGIGVGEITRITENDYNLLNNKPSIETVELIGDKSFEELGMMALTNMEIEQLLR